MRNLRKCFNPNFNTGVSKCPPDFEKMKGAILVEPGTKLPASLTGEKLEKAAHAARANRIYGIVTFVEYAPNGGEMQSSANGYGPEEATGMSARKDTYTLNRFNPSLHASLTRCKNKKWDVYFFDASNILYGINDGTDTLAGYPMSTIYSNATPHPTSSQKSQMTVTFCHEDAEFAAINFDFEQLTFNPSKLILGLTLVKLDKGTGSTYKLYEVLGGADITPIYGPLFVGDDASASAIAGATAVSYSESTESLTITTEGTIKLKAPSALYELDIKGIEAV